MAAFLTGIKGVNQPAGVVGAEMLRLNTSIAATAEAKQHRLGVLGGDMTDFMAHDEGEFGFIIHQCNQLPGYIDIAARDGESVIGIRIE